MRLIILALVITSLVLSGCSRRLKDAPERTEAEHYAEIERQMARNNFLNVLDELQELEARFPYGDYAEQAQLDLIYTQYRAMDHPAAIAAATRFIRNFPASDHLDYALYMRGLANYNLDRGIFDRFIRTGKSTRDLSSWDAAFQDFEELIKLFPDSEFAPDSRARMIHIRNNLAEQELHIARYYARRQAFIAAANRAQHVVRHFQETPAIPEALAIMNRAYLELGQKDLADKSLQVLAYNWPDSPLLTGNHKADLDWWPRERRTWLRLLSFDLLD